MRLATTALLLAATALTAACSGKTIGTGTGSLPGADPKKSGFVDVDGGTCPDPTVDCEYTDPGTVIDGGSTPTPAPSIYDPLFVEATSVTATPNSITGLWSGAATFETVDVRLLITPSAVTIALRCNASDKPPVTVGLTVNAVVSSTGIRILDTKSTGASPCQIIVRPQSMDRCSTGSGSLNCFDMNGTALDFHTGRLFTGIGSLSEAPAPEFEKLTDGT